MSTPTYFGRYRVLEVIAHGQMGTVYLADDPVIGRRLAIKSVRIDPSRAEDEVQRLHDRFRQEIKIAGTFSHPNIVTLYDVGQQDGATFVAMELVDGESLSAYLQRRVRLPLDEAVALVEPIADALRYAHERGVVHRDVKPSNVLLSVDGVPKIGDFGLARLSGSRLTQTGSIIGAPAYMSPEQADGKGPTGASDQFSLAVMTYEMLSGSLPFLGESPAATVYQVRHSDPVPLDAMGVPADVSAVVMRGLCKNPSARYAGCREFAAALSAAVYHGSQEMLPEPRYGVRAVASVARSIRDSRSGWRRQVRSAWSGLARGSARAADALRDGWRGFVSRLPSTSSPTSATPADPSPSPWWSEAACRVRGVARQMIDRPWTAAGGVLVLVALIGSTWALGGGSVGRSVGRGAGSGDGAGTITPPGASTRPAAPATGAPERDGPGSGAAHVDLDDEAGTATAADGGVAEGTPLPFEITSRPSGARVILDGEPISPTPAGVQLVPGRRYELRIEHDGFRPLRWGFGTDDLTPEHLASGRLHFPLRPLVADRGTDVGDPPGRDTEPEIVLASSFPVASLAADPGPPTDVGREGAASNRRVVDPVNAPRLRAPSEVPFPEVIESVEPVVAAGVRAAGVALVEVEVNAQGRVVQARIVRGLSPALDRAALDAVIRRRYAPTVRNGEPVHVVMTVAVRFDGS